MAYLYGWPALHAALPREQSGIFRKKGTLSSHNIDFLTSMPRHCQLQALPTPDEKDYWYFFQDLGAILHVSWLVNLHSSGVVQSFCEFVTLRLNFHELIYYKHDLRMHSKGGYSICGPILLYSPGSTLFPTSSL